ncbi:hypothetical protein CASFOL_035403 [Castilleja foliolosa]|uniref:C2H2-type domain-containing protein n=1 Tax=Castilleja foliolosa TaxID=1961234 RepID=A0ABD3BTQ6_9LAMI
MSTLFLRRRLPRSLISGFLAGTSVQRITPLQCVSPTAMAVNSPKSPFARHVSTFPDDRFMCNICKARFRYVHELTSHFQNVHCELYNSASASGYICKCGCCYNDLTTFTQHLSVCPHLRFEYPPKDWVKLNTDGYSNDDGSGEGMSGGGGLIRSSTGHSYLQFRGQLGISTPLLAELWALDKGLDFIITTGFKRVVIGVENEDIIKGMKDESWKDDLSEDGNVLEYITRDPENATKKYYMLNIKSVLNDPSIDFEVHQILPEGNIVADDLAAKAMESGELLLRDFDGEDECIKKKIEMEIRKEED